MLFLVTSFGLSAKLRIKLSSSMWISAGAACISGGIALAAGNCLTGLHPLLLLSVLVILYTVSMIMIVLSRFFRDPERKIPYNDNVLVSPADGTVLYIKKLEDGTIPISVKQGRAARIDEMIQTDMLSDARYILGIEMNVLNVHVNRSPVDGKITFKKHIPGSFLSLRNEESPVRNERLTTVIDQGAFKIAVIQIASRLVRRIDSYVDTGDIVTMGDRIGMIRFGSQVDVIIPALKDLEFAVGVGDEVTAGTSLLATHAASS